MKSTEKYVDGIVRKVKCSHKKREEIRKEILADMTARKEGGEDWQQIMESMGTTEEIAEEFNQNLSSEEKKSYKRGRIGKILGAAMAVVLIFGLFIWWFVPKGYPTGHSGYFTQEALEKAAEETVALLEQDDFEALKAMAIPQMLPYLTQEKMDTIRGEFGDDWGEMQAIGTVYTQELEQQGNVLALTQMNVSYANVSVTYTFMFDQEMKLAGLYVK